LTGPPPLVGHLTYLWPPDALTMLRPLPLLATAALVIMTGCSTDLDINAPYKDSTVVYALFNMREDTHYVKINKAFLGEGNALTYAQIADSNEYAAEDIELARVIRFTNGNPVDSFELQPITINNRVPGTFYAPQQRLYYFAGQQQLLPVTGLAVYLDPASEYQVKLRVKGNNITAKTNVVNDFTIQTIDQDTTESLNANRVNFMNATGTDYGQYEFNWTSRLNGKRYEVSWRFRYDEVRGQDTIRGLSITQKMGSKIAASSSTSEPMSLFIPGETFYSTLAARIPVNAAVDKRIFRGLDFLVSVANDEFDTFLTLSEPVSGIIEDRPAYTNITGAYGIVAGRYTKNVIGKRLGANSLIELIEGPYTAQLRFCSGLDPGTSFSCN
jgi:hypothetical protein